MIARDDALEASQLKSELLAKVSHELRTPLGSILGITEMLKEGVFGQLSGDQEAAVERVMVNTNDLIVRVNELLEQTQLDAGKLKLNVTSFAVADMIDQVQSQMYILAYAKGLTLTSEINEQFPAIISGDLARIQQVLVNLVGNAIKFTKSGQVQVQVSHGEDDTSWVLRVSDTGPGIPLEAQYPRCIIFPMGDLYLNLSRFCKFNRIAN